MCCEPYIAHSMKITDVHAMYKITYKHTLRSDLKIYIAYSLSGKTACNNNQTDTVQTDSGQDLQFLCKWNRYHVRDLSVNVNASVALWDLWWRNNRWPRIWEYKKCSNRGDSGFSYTLLSWINLQVTPCRFRDLTLYSGVTWVSNTCRKCNDQCCSDPFWSTMDTFRWHLLPGGWLFGIC